MKECDLTKKRIVFMIIMLIVGSLFILVYLSVTGNKPEIFTDVCIEFTSILSSNKSSERNLVFILIFSGIIIYSFYYILTLKKYKQDNTISNNSTQNNFTGVIVCFFAILAATNYLIFTNVNPILFITILMLMALLIIDKNLVAEGFVCVFTSTYAVYGLYRLYVFFNGEKSINNTMVALIVSLIFILLLMFKNKRTALIRTILITQLFVPFTLLIYLMSRYKYNNEFINIALPYKIILLIIVLIIIFAVEAIIKIFKKWNQKCHISELITFGTCVSIMVFNRFGGTGAIISSDLHHSYENIIGFSQVFELGRKLFSEYIPVSGMYSIVQGAILKLFGNDFIGNYYITENIFYLGIVVLIIALLWKQVDKIYILLISLLFYVLDYNRVAFLLPIMLLLIMPQLIKRKNLWLHLWFLTSLFHGLYYPIFGAAACIAFIPLGVYQIVSLVKTGELKLLVKTKRFWIGWGLSAIVLIAMAPYLWGTFKHIRVMADQTIYADGIARFGQYVPSWFFAYLNGLPFIRIALYDIVSFLVISVFVWIAYALAVSGANVNLKDKKICIKNKKVGFIMLAVAIAPIICYTSTVVRMDIDSIFARSIGIMLAGAVLLIVFINTYLKENRIKCLAMAVAVFIPMLGNAVGFLSTDSKLSAYYTVPENYVYIENDAVKRLGTCFAEKEVYDLIETTYKSFEESNPNDSYMGKPCWFGEFYLCNTKGSGPMELAGTVKGYKATQETVENARHNQSIIGPNINPLYNYYLYHWLLTSGEYIWSSEKSEFIPNNGKYTKEQVRNINQKVEITYDGFDVGKNASSLGLSFSSLQNIMTKVELDFAVKNNGNKLDIRFDSPLSGDDADYMYIEFDGMANNYQYTLFNLNEASKQEEGLLSKYLMKKNYNPGMQVEILWTDDMDNPHYMLCTMSEGKLLIPLGAGNKWLLNDHSSIRIIVTQNGQEIEMPAVNKIEYLKLREIK